MIEPDNVVTLRALGLGDFLTGVPALRALRRAYPHSRHFLATPRSFEGLLSLAGLEMDIIDTPHLRSIDLPNPGRLLAVNLHGRGPQSHQILLRTRPEAMLAFENGDVGNAGPVWLEDEHEVRRWCRLLDESGIEADALQYAISAPDMPTPEGVLGSTVIHPGATSAARRWPVTSWELVVRHLIDRGEPVLITGSSQERHLANDLARSSGLGRAGVLAGRTDLVHLAAIVAAADLVVCGDTGVAHLATALGTPSVLLFGPTDPRHWGPLAGPHEVVWKGTTGDPHASVPDAGLLAITVSEVIEAMDRARCSISGSRTEPLGK